MIYSIQIGFKGVKPFFVPRGIRNLSIVDDGWLNLLEEVLEELKAAWSDLVQQLDVEEWDLEVHESTMIYFVWADIEVGLEVDGTFFL